jgi:primosomal protein N' (replication factor Y)
MFVRVAVNIPSEKTFSYAVPEKFEKSIVVGKRVFVPFGRKRLTGYILAAMASSTFENIKEIIDVLDPEPLFDEEDLRFYQWASDYYMYPLGKTLTEILPGGIDVQSHLWFSLNADADIAVDHDLSDGQRRIVNILKDFPGGLSAGPLKKLMGRKDIYHEIRTLQTRGLVEVDDRVERPKVSLKKEKIISLHPGPLSHEKMTERQRLLVDYLSRSGPVSLPVLRQKFENASTLVRNLMKKGLLIVAEHEAYRRPDEDPRIGVRNGAIILNDSQKAALREILKGLSTGRFSPYLLHGVTGSGKTEVYLQAIVEAVKDGGGVICLVPEIALTPQLMSRFKESFHGQEIAVLHSGISKSARYDQWRRIQRGDIRIIVGARSALFAPVRKLRLIIVDEEHDGSYKQDDRMRYNARDLALVKAKLHAATVVLGSATPSLETYLNSTKKRYRYLRLPQRVEDRPLPRVEIIDMKVEKDERGSVPILSRSLKRAIQETLEAQKQVLLFLNRRGFNTFLSCLHCGHVFCCLNCAVSLTHHAREGILKCHYCDLAVPIPLYCPACQGSRIQSYGVGTERLEETVKSMFPQARVARMDSDTTTGRGDHGRILHALDRFDIDILVGTQMITKGHDFPNVTLVGVISADTALNIPDFRAAEKTFQLLTQVSGRGGRGDDPGRVIIQTLNPDHYAIRRAREHDCEGFYSDELPNRQSLSYPPFTRIVNLHISSLNKDRGREIVGEMKRVADDLSRTAPMAGKVDIIGPAESPIARIKGRYRWQLLLKGEDSRALHELTRAILDRNWPGGLDIKVDVDPLNFM